MGTGNRRAHHGAQSPMMRAASAARLPVLSESGAFGQDIDERFLAALFLEEAHEHFAELDRVGVTEEDADSRRKRAF